MKKIILSILTLLALVATPPARAWTYNDGDLLLIFRESGLNDIEYDLGSVSNLLGQTNGYTTTLTNWNTSLITAEFGAGLPGAEVILLASTSPTSASPTAWLSGTEPDTTAYNPSQSEWTSDLYGTISAIGNKPVVPFAVPPAAGTPTNAYSINPYGTDAGASYDYIVSGGTYNGIAELGGNAPFTVQQAVPGSLDFWAIQPTSIYPNPPPDTLVGTFTITTNGVLTFVAGPRQSDITGVTVSNDVSTIQFTTTVGNHYSVAYTNALGGAVSTWPVDGNSLIGNGAVNTLNHTNNNNPQEFYQIVTH
ncbi:MAG: hypothetical protein ABR955_02365 [Verrucomicrobiota bacterium]|jgi:hypothetical protein